MSPIVRIGDWQLEADRNRLKRRGESVRLEPKVADVLRALLARAGEVVSKEELIHAVWGDVAVSDEVLTTAVYQLRRALSDDPRAPRYIETIPRRGYRLMTLDRRPFSTVVPRIGVAAASLIMVLLVLAHSTVRSERRAARELHEIAISSIDAADPRNAARILRRAAELDPNNSQIAGHLALALALSEEGSMNGARSAARRALALEPDNPHALTARGITALWADWRWLDALRDLRRASRTGDETALAWLAYVSALAGDPAAARISLEDLPRPTVANAVIASTTYLLLGDLDAGERILRPLLAREPANQPALRQMAKIDTRRRGSDPPPDPAVMLASLERAWRERDHRLLYLRVDDRWDPIREHPRFQAISGAIGP